MAPWRQTHHAEPLIVPTSDVFDRVVSFFEEHYPKACAQYQPRENLHRLLFNPDSISLSKDLAKQAESVVRAFGEVRELRERNRLLAAETPTVVDPGNYSALMSYDFHVDEASQLRLIEINTNASLSLITDCLVNVQSLQNGFSPNFRDEIVKTFEEEAALAGVNGPLSIAIIDEKPQTQRLYFEFLLYKELFEARGHRVVIADSNALVVKDGGLWADGLKINFVYNRDTDF